MTILKERTRLVSTVSVNQMNALANPSLEPFKIQKEVVPTGQWKVIYVHDQTYDLYIEVTIQKTVLCEDNIGRTNGLLGFFKRPIRKSYTKEIAGLPYYIHERDLHIETITYNKCDKAK